MQQGVTMSSTLKALVVVAVGSVIAMALAPAATAASTTVNYQHLVSPTPAFLMEDADLRQSSPNVNFAAANINLGTLNAGGNQRMRSVMSFDLDALGGLTP